MTGYDIFKYFFSCLKKKSQLFEGGGCRGEHPRETFLRCPKYNNYILKSAVRPVIKAGTCFNSWVGRKKAQDTIILDSSYHALYLIILISFSFCLLYQY